MPRRKMLECCECGAPALPATGRMEYDARKAAWFDGDSGVCRKCGTKLRVYIEPDYEEDQVAQVVTESRYGDWSLCSCKGNSHHAREYEHAGKVLADVVAKAEARGAARVVQRIVDMAKRLNYGPTLRTFIKKISRGEHEEG